MASEYRPLDGLALHTVDSPQNLSAIIFGAGTFGPSYNTEQHLESDTPLQTVRLALRYGVNAFDTSVYYGPSEIVLGRALNALKDEYPRPSYRLMTKCGRYGIDNFDYSPARVRESVKQSLTRLQTDYLDTVYLHDIEFVADPIAPRASGNHALALTKDRTAYGLAEGQEGTIRGEGDKTILAAYAELRKLKEEGLVRKIGLTGFPLPVLLRIALLIQHTYEPVDVILSYSHLSLQNRTFLQYVKELRERAKVAELVAASPFSMGLLTPSGPPPWHPAPSELRAAALDANKFWPQGLANLALGWSIRNTGRNTGHIPLVAGLSTPAEVNECMTVWREIQEGGGEDRRRAEEVVQATFEKSGYLDWSWESGRVQSRL